MPSDTQNKRSILDARHHDPFSYLGLHQNKSGWVLRVFQPHATEVAVHDGDSWQLLERDPSNGFYLWRGKQALPAPCRPFCPTGLYAKRGQWRPQPVLPRR